MATSDPIAIVGCSCRLPAAPDVESFWDLLYAGRSAITEVPADRWPVVSAADPAATRQRLGVRYGGFLDRVDLFDAGFFGISPKEAAAMDPQQRLVLELAWEAVEDAGIVPATLRGVDCGVFVGAMADDYGALALGQGAEAIGRHTLTGLNRGIIANRVAFTLGLHGPSLTVDSGQSSAAVAIHLACKSIRAGESRLALAAGVNLNLVAEGTLRAQRLGALSPDGRCYTFDARANGYVRGEGGAAVLLKPLSQALADGDDVYCVVLGSAVNSDGATTSLGAPDARAQEQVVRAACTEAGVQPSAVQYVELHGTGTRVGDPVEAAALGAALGAHRTPGSPLLVGSVKTNIGHLEGAAGIAGLLKAALCIRHRQIPASLNFETPNPDIPLDRLNLSVPRTAGPWPYPDSPLVAGVSSFGIGGTNCHLLLGEAPGAEGGAGAGAGAARTDAGAQPAAVAWPISAGSPSGLRATAARLAGFVAARPDLDPADVGFSLASTRSVFEHRAVVVARDHGDFRAGLDCLAQGGPAPNVVAGRAGEPGGTVLVFPGQGSQWPGMARELLAASPAFREQVLACSDAFAAELDWSLPDVLRCVPGAPALDRDEVVQPALFTVMVALAALWRSVGVHPDAVVGHSQGEIAAAYVAGALSLADCARLVVLRSRAVGALAGTGGMVAVALPAEQAAARLAAWPGRLGIAAINGPGSTVVSGETGPLDEMVAWCREAGIQYRRVPVSYASHSPAVDALRVPLLGGLSGLRSQAGGATFYSTVTGGPLPGGELDAEYWFRNLRQTVRFDAAVRALHDAGHRTFIEASPHPILTASIQETLAAVDPDTVPVVAGSLRRDEGWDRFLLSAAQVHSGGTPVAWPAVITGGRRVRLPTYPFQRERHWLSGAVRMTATSTAPEPAVAAPAPPGDSLAGQLAGRNERDQLRLVRDALLANVAATLGHRTPAAVDPARTFKELGFDSLAAVEFRDRIAAATQLRLPTSLTFDHPTPHALARHLRARLLGFADQPAVPTAAPPSGEPVAVVGVGCRLPGGIRSAGDLWRALAAGTQAISAFPADRGWPEDTPAYPRVGGFVADATRFDAAFFGISPREAVAMDPQQRMLLEVCWEAVERAGIDPYSLRDSGAGVFLGVSPQDYGPRAHEAGAGAAGYVLTGTALSVASGRVAYSLGLAGPAVTVDTACSSSLVAIHLACGSLRSGECDMALAGGATVMATPGIFAEFAAQGGLAGDGRCKPFSAAADGTGWAEGAGIVVLERLSEARRRGHPIWAVIRGSATNQDGASNGLTAPSGPAQQRVIRSALAAAGLRPDDIDAVEAHGTGTVLGDPIEAGALAEVYRPRRPERPLWIRSVKANIGHTQAAAGVTGLISAIMAIRHGIVPPALHADQPTTHVDWSEGVLALPAGAVTWPRTGRPRRAGVSSFGISGTNAHLIVEQAPAADPQPQPPPVATAPLAWPVSAKTPAALREQARRLYEHCGTRSGHDLAAVGYALASTRTTFGHRAVIVGRDRAELLDGVRALAEGTQARGLVDAGERGADPAGGIAFVLPGQGAHQPGMGRELYARYPAFAHALDLAAEQFDAHLDAGLRQVLLADPGTPESALLDDTRYTQAALFAFQLALYRLLESAGLTPDHLIGHSLGEITAAHLSGVLTLADAATLVATRGALMHALPDTGAMAAVQATEEELRARLAGRPGLSIAAVNGAQSAVVSGDGEAVEALVAEYRRQGRRAVRLSTSRAYHSAHTDAILARFRSVADAIGYQAPAIPVVSTLTGRTATAAELGDPAHWTDHIRQPVRFADAVAHLYREHRPAVILELSARPTLAADIHAILPDQHQTHVASVLDARTGEPQALLRTLAGVHVRHTPVRWQALYPPGQRAADLPTYPFERRRYWHAAPAGGARGPVGSGHPLAGVATPLAQDGSTVLTGQIGLASHPWLADHAIGGTVVLPAAAFTEIVRYAAGQAGYDVVDELTLHAPLVLPAGDELQVQVAVGTPDGAGRCAYSVHARPLPADGARPQPWRRHATGTLSGAPADPAPPQAVAWPPSGAVPVDLAAARRELAGRGYAYGPAFHGLRAAWRDGSRWYAEVVLPDESSVDSAGYGIHPALLDAAFQAAVLAATPATGTGGILVPFTLSGVRGYAPAGRCLRVTVASTGAGGFRLELTQPAGQPVLAVGSLVLRPVDPLRLHASGTDPDGLLYLGWQPVAAGVGGHGTCAVLGTGAAGTATSLRAAGAFVQVHPNLAALNTAVSAGAPVPGAVVHAVPAGPAGGGTAGAIRAAVAGTLAVLQEFQASDRLATSRLVVLTERAVATRPGQPVPDLAQAAVWGLIRCAQAEHPGRFVLVDLDGDAASAAALVAALASGEAQLAVRGGRLLAPRLSRSAPGANLRTPEGAWRLDCTGAGGPDSLTLAPWPEAHAPLSPGQVRVAVRAGGLNFRDVLIALGRYPQPAQVGCEGAGVVTEVHPEVTGLAPGDAVMGLLPGIGPVAVTDHRLLAHAPDGWSWAQAAGTPVVFLTAYACLAELAGLKRGQAVLIHAGTGGVGMAAIQIAQHLGARVYATSSPQKWPVLRALGVADADLASSRTVEYGHRFGPVDVVLNSLTGEHVDASLRLLRDGGRFIEIGKADRRDPRRVEADHPGVGYRLFDLLDVAPERVARWLAELRPLFDSGALRPLPLTAWDVRTAPLALRHLARARHTGKNVVTLPVPLDPNGTVLITGTGPLARRTARHLATRYGCRHLLMANRSGAAAGLVDELAALGAQARVVACDVADRQALAELLAGIPAGHPLTAVVHTAGVLDDATVEALTPAQLDRVLRAKADSAWYLHELTRDRPLSTFVLYSSVSAVLGNPGQAGYAAANAVLDALASQRRAAGLPAVSVGWGLWDEATGMAGGLDQAGRSRLRRQGVAPLPAGEALALLDAALAGSEPAVVAARLDLADADAERDRSPVLADLMAATPATTPAAAPAGAATPIAGQLAGKDTAEQERLLLDLIRRTAATVLGRDDPDGIGPADVFKELGFDSLAAVEFGNRIAAATGLRLPATLTFDHPSPGALATHLRALLAPAEPPPAGPPPAGGPQTSGAHTGDPQGVLDRIEELVAGLPADSAAHTEVRTGLRRLLWRLDGATAAGDGGTDDELIAALESELRAPPG